MADDAGAVLSLDLKLSEEQVESFRLQRAAHLQALAWREQALGTSIASPKRAAPNRDDQAEGAEDESDCDADDEGANDEEEEQQKAAMMSALQAGLVTQFTNGTVFPAGKHDSSLFRLTPLTRPPRPRSTLASGSNAGLLGGGTSSTKDGAAAPSPPPPPPSSGAAPEPSAEPAADEEDGDLWRKAPDAAVQVQESWEDAASEDEMPSSWRVDLSRGAAPAKAPESRALADAPVILADVTRYLNGLLADGMKEGLTLEQAGNTIQGHLAASAEGMDDLIEQCLEMRVFFHSTEVRAEHDILALIAHFPTARFAVVEYPAATVAPDGSVVHRTAELWQEVKRKVETNSTGMESVDRIKRWIERSGRTPLWKLVLLDELEDLAQREYIAHLERQEVIDRVADLETLRDEIEAVIGSLPHGASSDDLALLSGCQEKLGEVEASLEAAQREFDALRAEDDALRRAREQPGSEETTPSAVDMVLAMVMERCETSRGSSESAEDHVERILGEHRDIVQLWREEFGRLPYL